MTTEMGGDITQYPRILGGTTLSDTQQGLPAFLSGIDPEAHNNNHLIGASYISFLLCPVSCLHYSTDDAGIPFQMLHLIISLLQGKPKLSHIVCQHSSGC